MSEKKPVLSLGQQINVLMKKLEGVHAERGGELWKQLMEYTKQLPVTARPPELFTALARTFNVQAEDIQKELEPNAKRKTDFEHLVPKAGWLHDYVEYTRTTEPPTVFHFFTGMVALGATLGRNVSYDLGFGHVFPNMCVILVAPSGKCRKTSCGELGIRLYRAVGGTILADKITPEALVGAFEEKGSATGLIWAGELAQFLGKQKYMEGMIPLLTRLFDCPDVWTSATVTRKELTLKNVAFSMLGASTMDWLRTGIPSDSFGGGFMSRFLFVVQEDTPRSFPLPPPLPEHLKMKLHKRLLEYSHVRGRFKMTPAAEKWYVDWYNAQNLRGGEEKQFSGYYERKPAWLIRISMLLSLSADPENSLILERKQLEHTDAVLTWLEGWLPGAFEQLTQTQVGEDHSRLIRQLKRTGGEMAYSDWLRKNSARMKATEFKDRLETLRQSKLVDYDPIRKMWYLTAEGWQS